MSTRTFLISAGVLGGGYYLYQSRLDAAQHPGAQTYPYRSTNTTGEGPGQYTGRKIDETAAHARDRAQDLRADANRKIDSTLGSVEHERGKAASWASDKLESTKDALDDTARSAQQKAQQFDRRAGELSEHHPSRLERLEHELKEEWDEVKEKKGSWFKTTDPDREVELAKNTKKSLEGWGESAAQNASEYYDSLVTSTKGVLGSSKPDRVYGEAKKAFDEAKRQFDDTKASWFSFSADEQKQRAHREAQRQLDLAQKKLDNASAKFDEWKQSTARSLGTGGGNKQYEGFYDWLRGGVPYEQERHARAARDAVRGWGDNASEAADEAYYAARDKRRAVQGQGRELNSSATKTAQDWRRWFNKKYDETSQGAREYYDDANDALSDAQRDLDANTKHWWQVWKSSSKDVELRAKRDVEEAQKRVAEASNGLVKWGEQVNRSFWKGAESAVDSVKSGLDTTNDKTQRGLSDDKGWIAEQN